jgi:hypothetical protein
VVGFEEEQLYSWWNKSVNKSVGTAIGGGRFTQKYNGYVIMMGLPLGIVKCGKLDTNLCFFQAKLSH